MRHLAAAIIATSLAACATDVTVEGGDHDEGEDVLLSDPEAPDHALYAAGSTVGDVARTACSTAAAKPLAQQVLAEVNCLRPGTLTSIAAIPGVSLGSGALAQLNAGAARALRNATNGAAITISSATRSTVQQYILYYWYQHGRCTSVVSLAAAPGRSNHESGVAIDVPSYSTWRSRLTAQGYSWLGSSDVVHFDYRGSGAVDLRPLAVKAFQRLWNRNHPSDRIAEDGAYGPQTGARIDRSPIAGFPIGPSCASAATALTTLASAPGNVGVSGVVYIGDDTASTVAGATVTIGGRTTITDADGSYQLADVPAGATTVTVTAPGFDPITVPRDLAPGVDDWNPIGLR